MPQTNTCSKHERFGVGQCPVCKFLEENVTANLRHETESALAAAEKERDEALSRADRYESALAETQTERDQMQVSIGELAGHLTERTAERDVAREGLKNITYRTTLLGSGHTAKMVLERLGEIHQYACALLAEPVETDSQSPTDCGK
jgi:hypothetical protein